MMTIVRRSSLAQRTGAALLLLLVIFAFVLPLLWPQDPVRQKLMLALQWPNLSAPFGYDHLGRSLFARLTAAIRLSLGLALVSVLSAMIPGILLGVLAAWRGGVVDRGVSLLADAFLALPGLLLVLLLTALVPDSAVMLYVGISLLLWVEYFRISRAIARPVLSSPAVQASRLLRLSPWLIFRRHLWPEMAPVVLTVAAFGAASAVMAIAALGFVSVGVRPPTPELGLMMTELLPYYEEAPYALLQPVAVVFLLVLSLLLLAGREKS
ncbi:ABC transporter permease [Erwinia persicina]|uniref:ABC transporter permease n=1 Tax=Erwinia persicina TaxID=55211 RepID=UPI001784ABA7|nr:ABC transporter permease subunit [Erwinia persicina]MBD8167201.1 ABC transporter permease [Erwinia persicina]